MLCRRGYHITSIYGIPPKTLHNFVKSCWIWMILELVHAPNRCKSRSSRLKVLVAPVGVLGNIFIIPLHFCNYIISLRVCNIPLHNCAGCKGSYPSFRTSPFSPRMNPYHMSSGCSTFEVAGPWPFTHAFCCNTAGSAEVYSEYNSMYYISIIQIFLRQLDWYCKPGCCKDAWLSSPCVFCWISSTSPYCISFLLCSMESYDLKLSFGATFKLYGSILHTKGLHLPLPPDIIAFAKFSITTGGKGQIPNPTKFV